MAAQLRPQATDANADRTKRLSAPGISAMMQRFESPSAAEPVAPPRNPARMRAGESATKLGSASSLLLPSQSPAKQQDSPALAPALVTASAASVAASPVSSTSLAAPAPAAPGAGAGVSPAKPRPPEKPGHLKGLVSDVRSGSKTDDLHANGSPASAGMSRGVSQPLPGNSFASSSASSSPQFARKPIPGAGRPKPVVKRDSGLLDSAASLASPFASPFSAPAPGSPPNARASAPAPATRTPAATTVLAPLRITVAGISQTSTVVDSPCINPFESPVSKDAPKLSTTPPPCPFDARVLFEFQALDDTDELSLPQGAVVRVLGRPSNEWWFGTFLGKRGHFPGSYVEPVQAKEALAEDEVIYGNSSMLRKRRDVPIPSIYSESSRPTTMILDPLPAASTPVPAPAPASTPSLSTPSAPAPAPRTSDPSASRPTPPPRSPSMPRAASNASVGLPPPSANVPSAVPASSAAADAATQGSDAGDDDLTDEILFCRVLYAYEALDSNQLQLAVGDVIEILTCDPAEAWWSGIVSGKEGWFPASYVVLCDKAEAELGDSDTEDDEPAGTEEQASKLQKAKRVVNELLETERGYVADLETIIRGYLYKMRPEVGRLFLEKSIDVIFSNIEQLHTFHVRFLESLDKHTEADVGQLFEQHAESFKIYAPYCNNFPRVEAELKRIQVSDAQVVAFFESVRMIIGSHFELGSLLLKPVQRVLKYPMLLRELLKNTPPDHKDHQSIVKALANMEKITSEINEDKRSKERLVMLQRSIEAWEGPDLSDTCTVLLHEGALMKISHGHNQERYFYLFDNVLLYCKRALTGKLSFKGKILTDFITIENVDDGERTAGKVLKFAFRINNIAKNKWYILYAKSAEEKQGWIDAFLLERQKVAENITEGINAVIKDGAADERTNEYAVKARQRMLANVGAKVTPGKSVRRVIKKS